MMISWKCTYTTPDGVSNTIPASVPGCLHTDLQRAGLVGDMYYRDNADSVQWIEQCSAVYTGTFTLDTVEPNTYLTLEGVDVYSDVYLNGAKLGETDNMFISWEYNVSDQLQQGENVLEIKFRSPVRKVEDLPKRNGAFTTERLYTRRIQCTYGWDWVARFVTMGIHKPVTLEVRKPTTLGRRNEGIYVYTKNINPYSAQVGIKLHYDDFAPNSHVVMEITDPDGNVVYHKKRCILMHDISELVDITDAKLWYPLGYGDQPIYTLTCRTYIDDKLIETKEQHFGIRQVIILEIEDKPDSHEAKLAKKLKEYDHLVQWDRNEGSSGFILLINGIRIFCQGADWVPCEPFPSAETPEKIEHLVRMAKDAGANMLRVWGGGIFENDAFYSACDREGVLVTQDFLMACGDYPEEDPGFLDQLRKEAREAAQTLRNHPSLVWWSGDNENAVSGDENMASYNGREAALSAIGPVLEVLDPERRFLPSSPYGGVPYASGTRGTAHNTQFLGNFFKWVRDGEFEGYREYFDRYLDRFTAEQPALGMPFVSSLRKFLTDEDIFGDDTSLSEYHTKNNPGLGAVSLYGYVDRLSKGIFGDYISGKDRVHKMQLLHCEWIRLSMELFRRNQWYSSGILYWMWNDCWPAANGWSIVDYYGCPKPAYYVFKRCAKPLISSILPDDDGMCKVYLSANGNSPESIHGVGRLYRYNILTGCEDNVHEFEVDTAYGESGVIYETPSISLDPETVLIFDIVTNRGSDRSFTLPSETNYAHMKFAENYGKIEIIRETDTEIEILAHEVTPFAMVDIPNTMLSESCMFMKRGERKIIYKEKLINV